MLNLVLREGILGYSPSKLRAKMEHHPLGKKKKRKKKSPKWALHTWSLDNILLLPPLSLPESRPPLAANHGQLRPTQAATKSPPSACLSFSLPLRHSLSLSLSRPFSLSTRFLFLPLSFFKLAWSPPFGLIAEHAPHEEGQKLLKLQGPADGLDVAVVWREARVVSPQLPVVLCSSPTSFGGQFGYKSVPLNLLFIIVPSKSEPNGALFWRNDLESILMAKNDFQRYTICICLESFAKKSHVFRDNL